MSEPHTECRHEEKVSRYELRDGYWGKYDPRRIIDRWKGVERFVCYDSVTGKPAPFSNFFDDFDCRGF
jgi:hypothetical protein